MPAAFAPYTEAVLAEAAGAGVTVRAESRYSGGPFRSTVIHRRLLRR